MSRGMGKGWFQCFPCILSTPGGTSDEVGEQGQVVQNSLGVRTERDASGFGTGDLCILCTWKDLMK